MASGGPGWAKHLLHVQICKARWAELQLTPVVVQVCALGAGNFKA